MSSQPATHTSALTRAVRKYLLSAFVAVTFAAYTIHVRLSDTAGVAAGAGPTQVPATTPLVATTAMGPRAPAVAQVVDPPTPVPVLVPTDVPSPVPSPMPVRGQFRDGRYTGPVVDAYYGNVQVQATVQNGRISDVQFLTYPNDRRTSVRINNVAIPYLTEEALQAQSANVDLVSGATLTSEAFVESLQSALATAGA
jgi:uncharacterized protein with FMN-binding domain